MVGEGTGQVDGRFAVLGACLGFQLARHTESSPHLTSPWFGGRWEAGRGREGDQRRTDQSPYRRSAARRTE
eukprot:364973-Chlamydomonas_euryale.AAC.16